MTLLAVPNEPALKVWVERVNPDNWIVIDCWDSAKRRYEYHELDRPEVRGDVSATVLEACFRSVGSTVVGDDPFTPDHASTMYHSESEPTVVASGLGITGRRVVGADPGHRRVLKSARRTADADRTSMPLPVGLPLMSATRR